ncbi:hypothetical protein ACIPRL_07930 [Streptomyces sp. NPDC090085]|uniref:hypothetical protein n=1 Tax=Streptomyces sp. NPDC090085 TaxID=3365943 RepID=UPI0037FEA867
MSTLVIRLADNLPDTDRNRQAAETAYERLAATGWTPIGGYPGSDVHWEVECNLCGWTGNMFYSHMRRDDRHGHPKRHRGCVALATRGEALAAWLQTQPTAEPGEETPATVRAERVAAEGEARAAHVEVETGPPKTPGPRAKRAASESAGTDRSTPRVPAGPKAAGNRIRVQKRTGRTGGQPVTVTVIHVNCACRIGAATLVGEFADVPAADRAAGKAARGTGQPPAHCGKSAALV